MSDDYHAMVATKLRVDVPTGIAHPPPASTQLFAFQRQIVTWALRLGRAAIFADCGLGKTAMQLEWANHVATHTARPVLILCPLAVAQQTVREGEKFGVRVRYVREPSEITDDDRIVITNYDRHDRFDVSRYGGLVLDESSILKAFAGKTKRSLVERAQSVPFRLACTATPAPNDHMELGNHSEFLGLLQGNEILGRWFINDTSQFGSYRLKGHAVESYWDWISSWACMIGRPSDMGYPDDGYDMPSLVETTHVVDVDVTADREVMREGQSLLFRDPSMSATNIHAEKRRTAEARAAKIADIVGAERDESWIVWCETDYEADALRAAMPWAREVRGSDSTEAKEEAARAFASRAIGTLVTKPKIFGWGLNWQHCARVAFVGATYSYEAYYQALRRVWRYGQTRDVHVHVVMATTESAVWQAMQRKREDHLTMQSSMFDAARRARMHADVANDHYRPTHVGRLPKWVHT